MIKNNNPYISIVIPLYNEEENLLPITVLVKKTMVKIGKSYELIFVDDGCIDGSYSVLREISMDNSNVKIIRFRRNYGQTAAFDAGFKAARGDVVITMDADMQNDPKDIPALLEKIEEYDVVCGWRFKRNDPFIKRISSKIANYVRNKLSKDIIIDTGCSLKAYRRDCLNRLKLFDGMHRFFPTLLRMEGFSVAEIKVNHLPRRYGKTKYNIRNRIFRSFIDLLAVRWMRERRLDYEIIEEDR